MTKLELVAEAISCTSLDKLPPGTRATMIDLAKRAIEALRPITPAMDAALRSHGFPHEAWNAALNAVISEKD